MKREFTRKEIYDLVWSMPVRDAAPIVGLSDVGLVKNCKKLNIPVPGRGYWARKKSGHLAVQEKLPARFPGTADRIGEASHYYLHGHDWVSEILATEVPPEPVFNEDLESVEDRARKLVGKIKYSAMFEPAHPLVAKLLAHDDRRREQFQRHRHEYYRPKYERGAGRRRLLIINALFLAAVRLGCRPMMSTSQYADDKDLRINVGRSGTTFHIEPTEIAAKREKLRLSFGRFEDRKDPSAFWEDAGSSKLENQLSEIFVRMLVDAERAYRKGEFDRRRWVIEMKEKAELEIVRRKKEAEEEKRRREEIAAQERLNTLLAHAAALRNAEDIRLLVTKVLLRKNE